MSEKPRSIPRRAVLSAGTAVAAGLALGRTAPATATGPPAARRAGPVALTHVTLIDATGSAPRRDSTVIVERGRISAIGRSGEVPLPPGSREIALAGKYLIPGLFDMHVHSLFPEGVLPQLYLATGITSVREMMGFDWVHKWRDRIDKGELLGPRWMIGSPILDGRPSIWSGNDAGQFTEVTTPAQARRAVRQAARNGGDFIKVYSRLDRECLRAIAEESRRLGLPFAGHQPDRVPLLDAARLGQRSIEHFIPALMGLSSKDAQVRRLLAAIRLTGDGTGHRQWFQQIHPADLLAARTYDPKTAAETFERLSELGTAITPTMVMHQVTGTPDDISPDPERLRYLPPGTQEQWEQTLQDTFTDGRTPEQAAQHREVFQHRLRVLGDARRAGVRVLAGTDAAGVAFGYPGFSLHDELALLVQAGFTPIQALQAATRDPARVLGLERSLGTIRTGHLADLVVLDADPMRDIRNTLKIHSVMTRGRYISAGERAAMLTAIETAARQTGGPAIGTGCCG